MCANSAVPMPTNLRQVFQLKFLCGFFFPTEWLSRKGEIIAEIKVVYFQ